MKGYKIFLAWLFTVILGSIGLPFIYNLLEGSNNIFINRELLGLILICIIISAILSLPTVITLLIRNAILKPKKLDFRKHFRKINSTHIFCAIITLLIIDSIIFYNTYESYKVISNYSTFSETPLKNIGFKFVVLPLLNFALVILWYMLCAIICWTLFFLSDMKNSRTPTVSEEKSIELNSEN